MQSFLYCTDDEINTKLASNFPVVNILRNNGGTVYVFENKPLKQSFVLTPEDKKKIVYTDKMFF